MAITFVISPIWALALGKASRAWSPTCADYQFMIDHAMIVKFSSLANANLLVPSQNNENAELVQMDAPADQVVAPADRSYTHEFLISMQANCLKPPVDLPPCIRLNGCVVKLRAHRAAINGGTGTSQPAKRPATTDVPAAKLVRSANAWQPNRKAASAMAALEKTTNGLLNKLTVENFEILATKLVNIDLSDTESVAFFTGLVYEKAVMEPHFSAVYAALCLFIVRNLPSTQHWQISDSKCSVFQSILIKMCQTEFARPVKWAIPQERVDADMTSIIEMEQIAQREYDLKMAKVRSLGNTKLIGELYNQGLITEAAVHSCISSRFPAANESFQEEGIEHACVMLSSVGRKLEAQDQRGYVGSYFKAMVNLRKLSELPSRLSFMLKDLIELHANRWNERAIYEGTKPATIAEIHSQVEKKREANLVAGKARKIQAVKPKSARDNRSQNGRMDSRTDSKGTMALIQ